MGLLLARTPTNGNPPLVAGYAVNIGSFPLGQAD